MKCIQTNKQTTCKLHVHVTVTWEIFFHKTCISVCNFLECDMTQKISGENVKSVFLRSTLSVFGVLCV